MLTEGAENINELKNYISLTVRRIQWHMWLLANDRTRILAKMGAAEENISTGSLTLKKMCERVSTEGSGRKTLRTIDTVDMSIVQSLRINSREIATTLTEIKLDAISLTCIWTKNKIFNRVHVIYAEYCLYRCTRQLITSLSLRCQFDSTYFFLCFLWFSLVTT